MNVETLILTLKCIPDDNNKKNTILKSIISNIIDINWADLANIISCYSDDNIKMDALAIIIYSKKKLGSLVWNSNYVSDIYHQFSFPSKIDAIKLLRKYIEQGMPQNVLVNVIKDIPSDSNKAKTVCLLMFELDTIVDIVQNVLPLISEDCNKIKALTYITLKKFNENDLKFAVQNITSDSAKIECIKLFLKTQRISCMLLLEICHTFSSNSVKCDCISEFAEKVSPIVSYEEFCQALAAEINDEDYYFKAAKILGLNCGFEGILVHAHRPQINIETDKQILPLCKAAQNGHPSVVKILSEHTAENKIIIEPKDYPDTPFCPTHKDISEDAITLAFDKKQEDDRKKWFNAYNPNNCIFGGEHEPYNRPGVSLISSSATASNSLIIVVKTYSDGSVYYMLRPIPIQ